MARKKSTARDTDKNGGKGPGDDGADAVDDGAREREGGFGKVSSGGGEGEARAVGIGEGGFPWWSVPVVYAAATLLLFREFVFSGEMLYGSDTLSLGYVAREFFAEALREGTFPLWNPVILGGTPFLDSLAGGDALYPTSLLLVLMEPFRALGWKLVIHVFLAGLFMYGWVRSLERSRIAAFLAGLAYLLAPFMVTLVFPGHDGKIFVTALTPALFWATEMALRRGGLLAFAGMAAVIALVILTTHFQQAYFLFGAVGIYALVRCLLLWRSGSLEPPRAVGRFGIFLLFSVLGAGVAGVQLLPAVEYVTEFSRRTATTTRADAGGSVAYSSSWSLHPEEVASLVVPEFPGVNVSGGADWTENTYWGRNPFKLNHEYAGLVVLLLALLSFVGAPGRGIRFTLAGIGGVALLYALGTHTPVWRIFYEVVPGISLFRAPSIAAFLFGFAAVTLMAFGVDRILAAGRGARARERGEKKGGDVSGATSSDNTLLLVLLVLTGALLVGTVLASSGILTSLWVDLLYRSLEPGKTTALAAAGPFITRGFFLATLLAGATAVLVWALRRGFLTPGLWMGGMALLIVVDLARVDAPFIQTMDFQRWAAPDPNIQYLQDRQEEEPPFRLLAMGGNQSGQNVKPGMYDIELAAGHHPNDLARYRELIGMAGSGLPRNFFREAEGRLELDLSLLSVLNVRYVLWPVRRFGGLPQGEVVMATTLGDGTPYEAVYEIPTLPRARLVGRAVILPDQEAVARIRSPDFRPAQEVTLPEAPPLELPGTPVEGEVRWLERGLNAMRLHVETSEPALLVLAENWYPAWKARVGGEETPVLRANHTLRAVPVPPGTHEVEVYYDRGWYGTSLLVTLLALGVVVGLGAVGLWRRRNEETG